MTDKLLDAILDTIKGVWDQLSGRPDAIEQRLAALEARPGLKYMGAHEPTQLYQPGDVVTAQGSMWACREAVAGAAPEDGSPCWTLCVKRGRN
jgi:hypothetical protein